MMIKMNSRILGLLVGCAYGDAMGMPSEMMSHDTFKKAFPHCIHGFLASTNYDFIGRQFEAGQVTDDTINTLLVCDAIIKNHGQFNVEYYIQVLQKWVQENGKINPYIMGPNTLNALTAIQNGTPIEQSGLFGTTNGSAMKVSPLGIITDYKDLPSLVKVVHTLCLPTHNTRVAIMGASIVASLVSYVLRNNKNINEMWNLAFDVMDCCQGVGNDLSGVSLRLRLEYVKEMASTKSKSDILFSLNHFLGAGMETVETIPAVMALLELSNLEPHICAELAANLNGDTDTIGAIATGICGAANNTFTNEEIKFLANKNNIDFSFYANQLAPYLQ